ncbi:MAG: methyltransferase domain-containing protein [Anaerolineae bacterium]|nr:methyltransferase domain-containing protein [Anaerolineae bacterium]
MSYAIPILFVLLLIALYYFIDREIYFYEGMRLGPRLQRWLYDRWAADYDKGKQASQAEDESMLARPILEKLADLPEPLILDLATGTGRLGLTLSCQPNFGGKIIALDISRKMLQIAARKLSLFRGQIDLIQYLTLPLPFPDESFDAVCCLEALEVMPEMEEPLSELYRVLRPGGLLVTSRGTEASGRKAKIRSTENFSQLLRRFGFEQVEITAWWKYFDRVFAQKPGNAPPVGQHNLFGLLRCKACDKIGWQENPKEVLCRSCGTTYVYSNEKILIFEIDRKE